jgi:integrase
LRRKRTTNDSVYGRGRQAEEHPLGKVSHQTAEKIKVKVEYLVAAVASACPLELETATWVSKIGDDLAGKLAAVGLIARRVPAGPLAEFLDSYIAGRTDHKPSTARSIGQTRRLLVVYFGADKPLNKITAADAENWRNELRAKGYKPATIATHIKRAKQMFRHAVDGEILDRNPFAKLKAPKQVDKSREVFIAQETILRVIEAAPDAEWRLIIALCRFGGLRCPSEILGLEWGRIDWERDRFTVFSPKLEHLPGGGKRVVPIFPELRPYLAEACELAEPGAVHVITRYSDARQNLRTQFQRIIRRAGLEPWERLFHNLRSSRQTELTGTFPAHVVAKWLGNTVEVATQHYLQVTEDHFRRGAESGARAVQNPVQQPAALFRTESQSSAEVPENSGICELVQLDASHCGEKDYPRRDSNPQPRD